MQTASEALNICGDAVTTKALNLILTTNYDDSNSPCQVTTLRQ